MDRLPRKVKKELKKLFKHRYGYSWLKCEDLVSVYKWFFKNPLGYDMSKPINN